MRWTPLALVPYAAMAAAIAGGYLWHLGDRAAGLAPVAASRSIAIGGPFHLTDQNGRAVTDANFRGRFLLVYFGYTNCPDVCPTTLATIARALDTLGPRASRVVPLFVTVDPARDSARVLKQYLSAFGPRFVGLTGSPDAIRKVAGEYRVFFRKEPGATAGSYAVDHSSTIYLIGPEGQFVTYYDESIGPDGLAKDLRKRL